MPSTHSADQSARDFLNGKRRNPILRSMVISDVMTNRGVARALCSYGPHFPVLVELGLNRVAFNNSEFGGDDYQRAKQNAGWRVTRVKASPTTRNHVSGAAYGLRAEGFNPTGETISIAGFDMDVYGKGV